MVMVKQLIATAERCCVWWPELTLRLTLLRAMSNDNLGVCHEESFATIRASDTSLYLALELVHTLDLCRCEATASRKGVRLLRSYRVDALGTPQSGVVTKMEFAPSTIVY